MGEGEVHNNDVFHFFALSSFNDHFLSDGLLFFPSPPFLKFSASVMSLPGSFQSVERLRHLNLSPVEENA